MTNDCCVMVVGDGWSIQSEPICNSTMFGQMCIKNVQYEGDTTRLTAQTEEVIVELLIQW